MDLGEIIGFTLDELSGPRALLYLLGLILLVLIRIGWELWRSNNQATKLIELSERLHKDMNVLATELRARSSAGGGKKGWWWGWSPTGRSSWRRCSSRSKCTTISTSWSPRPGCAARSPTRTSSGPP